MAGHGRLHSRWGDSRSCPIIPRHAHAPAPLAGRQQPATAGGDDVPSTVLPSANPLICKALHDLA